MSNKKVAFCGFYNNKLLEICSYFIPTGVVYCATAIQCAGWDVFTYLIEYTDYEEDFDSTILKLINFIRKNNISYLCISALSADFVRVRELVASTKEALPYISIVIGGGMVSADPQFVMKNCDADYGIIGEGEISLTKLLNTLLLNKSVSNIAGLCYRYKGQVLCNLAEDILELDLLPFPMYNLFPEYENAIKKGRIYPILLSRSCPFSCTFCFHTSGKKYRLRSIGNVIKEIRYAIDVYDVSHLFVLDELFGADKKQLIEFTEELRKMSNISFNVQTRADLINAEMLRLVKKAGCTNVSIGIESANNTVLSSMKKGVTIEFIESKLEMILEFGVNTSGNIIIGDIAETYKSAIESIEWFRHNWKRYNLNIGHIQIYPGTYIFEYAVKNNIINKETFLLGAKNEGDFIVNISQMNDDEYEKVRKEINKLRFFSERKKDYLF